MNGECLGSEGRIDRGIIRCYHTHDGPCVFSQLRHIYLRIKSWPKYTFWKGNRCEEIMKVLNQEQDQIMADMEALNPTGNDE